MVQEGTITKVVQKTALKDLIVAKNLLKPISKNLRLVKKLQDIKPSKGQYNINSEYILEDEEVVVLPKDSILVFTGNGKIVNGTVVGSNSIIRANNKVFFNTKVQGTWNCIGEVRWFANGSSIKEYNGVYIPVPEDDTQNIQNALDSSFRESQFPPKIYYVNDTLILRQEKKLTFQGSSMKEPLSNCTSACINTSIIYTDKNNPILRIAANTGGQSKITIEGGNFDVSLCDVSSIEGEHKYYTANCIEVLANNNEKIWGLNISSDIKGKFGNLGGVGININPINNQASSGYITAIHINSTISNFGIGIKASSYGYSNCWCTDLNSNSDIINCLTAVDSSADCTIDGTIQAGFLIRANSNKVDSFKESPLNTPLIRLNTDRAAIGANIFDIRLSPVPEVDQTGNYTGYYLYPNHYAIENNFTNAIISAYGLFLALLHSNTQLDVINQNNRCIVPPVTNWK